MAGRALSLVHCQDNGLDSILEVVDGASRQFDELALVWWPSYIADWSGLRILLDRARS